MKVSVSYWYNKGTSLADSNLHEKALYCFDKAITLDDSEGEVWFKRGMSQFHLKLIADAEESFKRCISLNPDNAAALNNLGVVLTQMQKFDEASGYFKKSMQADVSNQKPKINYQIANQISKK